MRSAVGLAATVWACLGAKPALASEDAVRLSMRGVKAYEEAKYALAEGFFEHALRDALLKGRADYAAMAVANWVDVLLETGRAEKASSLLQTLGPAPEAQAALIAWKKAQTALATGRASLCLDWLDSAAVKRPPEAWLGRLELDRLRCRFAAGDTTGLARELARRLKAPPENLHPGLHALAGEVAMSQARYPDADTHFEQALAGYREARRYARTLTLLWKRAACATASGQREAALRHLREALTISAEIGVEPAGMESVLAGFAKDRPESDFKQHDESGSNDTQSGEQSVSLPSVGAAPR